MNIYHGEAGKVTLRDWLDSIFNLEELLSLTEDELAVLEELEGDFALQAAWWRRRRAP